MVKILNHLDIVGKYGIIKWINDDHDADLVKFLGITPNHTYFNILFVYKGESELFKIVQERCVDLRNIHGSGFTIEEVFDDFITTSKQ